MHNFTKDNDVIIEFHSTHFFVKDRSTGRYFYEESVKMEFIRFRRHQRQKQLHMFMSTLRLKVGTGHLVIHLVEL